MMQELLIWSDQAFPPKISPCANCLLLHMPTEQDRKALFAVLRTPAASSRSLRSCL